MKVLIITFIGKCSRLKFCAYLTHLENSKKYVPEKLPHIQ